MRGARGKLSAVLMLLAAGCHGIGEPRQRPQHFRFASVAEIEVGTPLDRTLTNLLVVLRDRGITYDRPLVEGEFGRVFAAKDGMEYVFDIQRAGEHGCRVRLEISRPGQRQVAENILRQLQFLAG